MLLSLRSFRWDGGSFYKGNFKNIFNDSQFQLFGYKNLTKLAFALTFAVRVGLNAPACWLFVISAITAEIFSSSSASSSLSTIARIGAGRFGFGFPFLLDIMRFFARTSASSNRSLASCEITTTMLWNSPTFIFKYPFSLSPDNVCHFQRVFRLESRNDERWARGVDPLGRHVHALDTSTRFTVILPHKTWINLDYCWTRLKMTVEFGGA